MGITAAIGLIMLLVLSACAATQQTPVVQTTTETAEEPQEEESAIEVAEAEEAEAMPGETAGKPAAKGGDINILGKDGFDPAELKISGGSAVRFVNNANKVILLTFFKDGKFYQNSPTMNAGESFDMEFSSKGSYQYWTIQFGVKATITVE